MAWEARRRAGKKSLTLSTHGVITVTATGAPPGRDLSRSATGRLAGESHTQSGSPPARSLVRPGLLSSFRPSDELCSLRLGSSRPRLIE